MLRATSLEVAKIKFFKDFRNIFYTFLVWENLTTIIGSAVEGVLAYRVGRKSPKK